MINERILKERKTGIGGSDVAAILGLSRYATPVDIWLEKIGCGGKKQETEAMHFGNALEAVIAQEYALRNNENLSEPTEIFRHRKYPFLLANPDRLMEGKNGILECKNAGLYKAHEWGEEGTDQIPTEYLLQAAHYRHVLNADFVDIAVLLGGNIFRQYRYTENKNLEEKMEEKLIAFWRENVENRCEPPMKTRKDVEALLTPSNRIIEADKSLRANLERLFQCKKDISKIENEVSTLQDKICVAMGEASVAVDEHGEKICTYKSVSSNRFDSSTFKKIHGDVYNKYLKENVSRVLRLNQAYNFNFGG
jgi:putative phage-type endonuclease